MNPYKHIEAQKQVINDLKYKLQYSTNKPKDAKLINTLIDTVLAFESMLKEKYYTDTIELLIYSRMYNHFMRAEVYDGKAIPLPQFNEWLKRDLAVGVDVVKFELKDVLQSHELANKLKDRANFNTDFADWEEIITKTMNEIKTNIQWKKLT